MKILHTADWHMNNRLGYEDLSADIVGALEQIAVYLESEDVDVLLVAGDLFSEKSRDEGFQKALGEILRAASDAAIVIIAGNHDSELKFESLRHALWLSGAGAHGKFVLTANPQGPICLTGRDGQSVQFILLPYPTPRAYLDGDQKYTSVEEKNRVVQSAFSEALSFARGRLDPLLPSVLVSHIHLRGAHTHSTFEITENEDVIFDISQIPNAFAYAAYGHIHKPGPVGGAAHIRYSGSPIALDAAERHDAKSCALFEIRDNVLAGEIALLPIRGPKIHVETCDLTTDSPEEAVQKLAARVAKTDLLNCTLRYNAGQNLNIREIRQSIKNQIPRVYALAEERINAEFGDAPPVLSAESAGVAKRDAPQIVREYLTKNLENHARRESLLARAESLLARQTADEE